MPWIEMPSRLPRRPASETAIPTVLPSYWRRWRRPYTSHYKLQIERSPPAVSRCLTRIQRAREPVRLGCLNTRSLPTLYVLNAAARSKPNAVQHLATDLASTGASVAVITQTHFKQKHTDSADSFTLFRQDRSGRPGGGVAVYVNSSVQSSVWWPPTSAGSRAFELLWVRVGDSLFVAALYHPPRTIYDTADLLSYTEKCIAELSHDYRLAEIVLAGDFNQLSDDAVIERTGLTQIVRQSTRGVNVLDRVFVTNEQLYSRPTVRVLPSGVRSDHKVVVAMSGPFLLFGDERAYWGWFARSHLWLLTCTCVCVLSLWGRQVVQLPGPAGQCLCLYLFIVGTVQVSRPVSGLSCDGRLTVTWSDI